MRITTKLSACTLLLSLVACADAGSNTATSSSTGGEGGSASSTTGQGGSATTTSSGEGGASNTTTGVGGAAAGGGDVGGGGVGGGGVGGGGVGGGGVGGGGGSGCTQITLADLALNGADGDAAAYVGEVSPNLGGADVDGLQLEFYGPGLGAFDGDAVGSFDLTANGDDNYATCSRCLRVFDDADKVYFQSQGALVVEADSQQLIGYLNATVTGLRLVEVTIDPDTFVSTPVPNGACLEIASADLDVGVAIPAGWTCSPSYLGDMVCDCGCGATDVDCAGDMTVAACDACNTSADGGCATSATCPSNIDPTNNAVCTTPVGPPAGWTCPASYYGDAECDCGCGVIDVDCAGDMTATACLHCNGSFAGGCNAGSGCPGTIDPTNNAVCTAPPTPPAGWTCPASYYGDTDCDCGCGATDVDCAGDMTVAACDFCIGASQGGCNSSFNCPGIINATNNAVCN